MTMVSVATIRKQERHPCILNLGKGGGTLAKRTGSIFGSSRTRCMSVLISQRFRIKGLGLILIEAQT